MAYSLWANNHDPRPCPKGACRFPRGPGTRLPRLVLRVIAVCHGRPPALFLLLFFFSSSGVFPFFLFLPIFTRAAQPGLPASP